jgi:hypothetical protein
MVLMSFQDYISPIEDAILDLLEKKVGHRAMVAPYAGEAGAGNLLDVMLQITSGGPAILVGYLGDTLEDDDTTGDLWALELRFGAYIATRNLTGQDYQQRDAYPLIAACRRAIRSLSDEVVEGQGVSVKVHDGLSTSVQPVVNTPDVVVYLVNYNVKAWVHYTG